MINFKTLGSAALILFGATWANAQTAASGILTQVGSSGGVNTFDISLTNTGTTNIGTFWFAWVPGDNYLFADPTTFKAPAGWAENLVSHDVDDGYGIRWEGSALAPGQTIDGFQFNSTDSLVDLGGKSKYHGGLIPVGTSVVYENGPFSGGSATFVVQAVPEAGTGLAMLGFSPILIAVARKRRRSA